MASRTDGDTGMTSLSPAAGLSGRLRDSSRYGNGNPDFKTKEGPEPVVTGVHMP